MDKRSVAAPFPARDRERSPTLNDSVDKQWLMMMLPSLNSATVLGGRASRFASISSSAWYGCVDRASLPVHGALATHGARPIHPVMRGMPRTGDSRCPLGRTYQ